MKQPKDYFKAAKTLPIKVLRFDFDLAENSWLITKLMNHCIIYIDYEKQEGPLETLEAWLKDLYTEDYRKLQEANDEDYPERLREHWLDFFDSEFDLAENLVDEHIIVYCTNDLDKGYEGDEMYFLFEKDDFGSLNIPETYFFINN